MPMRRPSKNTNQRPIAQDGPLLIRPAPASPGTVPEFEIGDLGRPAPTGTRRISVQRGQLRSIRKTGLAGALPELGKIGPGVRD
jgi:hypothetical protein